MYSWGNYGLAGDGFVGGRTGDAPESDDGPGAGGRRRGRGVGAGNEKGRRVLGGGLDGAG